MCPTPSLAPQWGVWDTVCPRYRCQASPSQRVAIAHCGDGGFLMTGQEMATAAQFGINIITVVYNNSALATIRMHQEAQYPNRPSGTDFVNPDLPPWALPTEPWGYR